MDQPDELREGGVMRVRKCQYCKCLVEEASWCDCAEAERDMRAFDHMVRASRSAPKPATTEPPEWVDDGPHNVTPDWWDKVAEAMFTARRKAKREKWGDKVECGFCGLMVSDLQKHVGDGYCHKANRGDGERAGSLSRAMSTPLPHDPDIHTRLMPWKGKEG